MKKIMQNVIQYNRSYKRNDVLRGSEGYKYLGTK